MNFFSDVYVMFYFDVCNVYVVYFREILLVCLRVFSIGKWEKYKFVLIVLINFWDKICCFFFEV